LIKVNGFVENFYATMSLITVQYIEKKREKKGKVQEMKQD